MRKTNTIWVFSIKFNFRELSSYSFKKLGMRAYGVPETVSTAQRIGKKKKKILPFKNTQQNYRLM